MFRAKLDRTKLRNLFVVVVCSTVGSTFFAVLIGEDPVGSFAYRPALIGAYNGCLISLSIASFEIFSGNIGALLWLKRAPFLVNVAVRSVFYLEVFALVSRS